MRNTAKPSPHGVPDNSTHRLPGRRRLLFPAHRYRQTPSRRPANRHVSRAGISAAEVRRTSTRRFRSSPVRWYNSCPVALRRSFESVSRSPVAEKSTLDSNREVVIHTVAASGASVAAKKIRMSLFRSRFTREVRGPAACGEGLSGATGPCSLDSTGFPLRVSGSASQSPAR